MQVKKQQLELDVEQQIGSKLWKEYISALYCTPAYLTYMQSASCEMPGWNQDGQYKYQQPQMCRWYHCNGRKQRGAKEPLDEGERREWKPGVKLSIQK